MSFITMLFHKSNCMFFTVFVLFALVVEYNCDSTNGIHDSLFGVTVYFGNCPSQSRKVVQAVDSSSVCRKGSTFYCEEYCTKRFQKEDELVLGGRCLQSRKGYKFSGNVGYGATCVCFYCKGSGASDTKCIEDVNSEVLPEDDGNPLCKLQSHKTCTEKCLSTFINAEKGLCRQKYGHEYECVCKTCGPAERFNLGFKNVPGTVDCRDIAPPTCVVGPWSRWSPCGNNCERSVRARTRRIVHANGDPTRCDTLHQCDTCDNGRRFNPAGGCAAVPLPRQAPPYDCVYSEWGAWSDCSETECFQLRILGVRQRQRALLTGSELCDRAFECGLCNFCSNGNLKRSNISIMPPVQRKQRTTTQSQFSFLPFSTTLIYLPVPSNKRMDLCSLETSDTVPCIEACVKAFKHYPVYSARCSHIFDTTGSVQSRCICEMCDYPRCVYGTWNDWSFCSARCNGGTRRRKRSLLTGDKNVCTDVMQYRTCNQPPCRIDCVVSQWSDWNNCSSTCGTGKQTRRRKMIVPPLYGGKCLFDTIQYRPCDADYLC